MIITKIANLNSVMDGLLFIVYCVVVGGLMLHFFGFILSGRFRERFINKHMKKVTPHDYLLLPIRICHWVHLICIGGLVFTGFCIRYKLLEAHMVVWKRHHFYLGIIVLINFVIRLIYAFKGRGKTYKDFPVWAKDLFNTPAVIKYYLFISDDYPHIAKYASLQKITYNFFWQFLLVQGITGFFLLLPELTLQRIILYTGSMEAAVAFIKVIHMALTWFYIICTTIHVYLSVSEGFPLFKLIMFNIEPDIVVEEKS